ncbi:transglutaminase domain-containing protein [Desulfovibrio mangrovi]|uniref:transglutaminase-like domain-containing protein n=1 Tax=Desulfovibrio mangrovi TaxID=2976983 RepID=UPI002247B666|nr:transglutaminase domain-containing protein [Desulfovibrio mangrovi]UZP68671.1 transglutaminase domain-containing protein [Desulfovibrio mangrovi]
MYKHVPHIMNHTARAHLLLVILSFFLALPFAAHAAAPSAAGTVTMQFDLSAQPQSESVSLWIPYPVSDADQNITNVRINGNYAESAIYTDKANGNPMLFARWDAGSTERKLSFTFNAERLEVSRRSIPATEPAWNPADYAAYLGATRLGPVDGEVRELALKITEGKLTVVEKAKAIYDWMCENTYRNPQTRGCGAGDVCALLKDPGGKCGDLSSLFIALLRSAGVPSREVFGIRLGKKNGDDISTWQHCWAEFFVPGYGWVPADPADVRKMMLTQNLKLEDAKTKEYREYYWGGIDPYRIRLSEGRDLTLTPPQQGEPVNYFMYPFAQSGNKTLDWLDPKSFSYTITFNN